MVDGYPRGSLQGLKGRAARGHNAVCYIHDGAVRTLLIDGFVRPDDDFPELPDGPQGVGLGERIGFGRCRLLDQQQ